MKKRDKVENAGWQVISALFALLIIGVIIHIVQSLAALWQG